uniref:Cystatin domain-containing protein n=1 Tax=Castor canadensis TaxID=51338 RepID=A0A8C0ZSA4_CASCN
MIWILQLLLATLAIALAMSPVASSGSRVSRIEETNVNDKGVQQAMDFVLKFYNDKSDDLYASQVVRVIHAKRQIVAGILYYLKIELGRTTCTKSQSDLSDCPFSEPPNLQKKDVCDFQVHSIPLEQKFSVVNYSCHSA